MRLYFTRHVARLPMQTFRRRVHGTVYIVCTDEPAPLGGVRLLVVACLQCLAYCPDCTLACCSCLCPAGPCLALLFAKMCPVSCAPCCLIVSVCLAVAESYGTKMACR